MMGLLNAQRPQVYFAGDVNGDGMLSDDDLTKLKNYLTYCNMVKNGIGSRFLNSEWNLSGQELEAADVNGDGTVDKDDQKELKNLLKH